MITYNQETPVLFIVFNRPDTTTRVFEQIRKAAPKRLYIAADGPRTKEEETVCQKVRDVVSNVDWDCTVSKLFHSENLGCGKNMHQSIFWFFENEPEGIVLEDDCLPADSFFGFCSTLLEKYRNDERIGHITGGNYQRGVARGDGSYYFSSLTNVWGWAGWRRVWKDYDFDIKTFPLFKELHYIDKMSAHGPFKEEWLRNFTVFYQHHHNSWDHQYAYLNLINGRIQIVPNVNLVSNIGCENNATHYIKDHPLANIPLSELEEIIHPSFMISDTVADITSQERECNVEQKVKDDSGVLDGYTFLKNKLVCKKKDSIMKIPKIIHQIYEDPAGPSDLLLDISETWKDKHPDWEYRFWDKQKIGEFLETKCSKYIPMYKSFLYDVQRWDAIRYLILYHYGGLYVDMDYECIENLEPLLEDSDCCMGMEPIAHAQKYSKPYIVGNALMASISGHRFFKDIVDTTFSEQLICPYSGLLVMESTGPFMITRKYSIYSEKENITLLPHELIAPLSMDEIQSMLQGTDSAEIENKVEQAFAIHYFLGSWFSQLKK